MSGEVPSDEQLVSVVIPTYNRTHCLPRAVDSVLARTHSQVEVIVIAEHRDRIRLSDHMLREVLAEAHGWFGFLALDRDDRVSARRQDWLSIRQKPWRLAGWRMFLMSLIPTLILTSLRSARRGIRSLQRSVSREPAHA